MLLPDSIHPEQTIYYLSAAVLCSMDPPQDMDILELYAKIRLRNSISMPVYCLCLDWLFLLEIIVINKQGLVQRCS